MGEKVLQDRVAVLDFGETGEGGGADGTPRLLARTFKGFPGFPSSDLCTVGWVGMVSSKHRVTAGGNIHSGSSLEAVSVGLIS